MNIYEYNLITEYKDKLITINDLRNKRDRILIYGHTIERFTFIIEIINGEIKKTLIKFGYDTNYTQLYSYPDITCNEDYIPNKRIFPNDSDFEFCYLLKSKGLYLPFTTFSII